MKLGLQIVLAVLSLIPAFYGARNMIDGVARFMPPEQVTAALDSQFRFQSAYYFGLALLIWWVIPNVERHTAVLRILIGVIFLGGVARVYSYVTVGAPSPSMIAAMALELALPLVILWHNKIRQEG